MKPEELRIGNWVQHIGIKFQVDKILGSIPQEEIKYGSIGGTSIAPLRSINQHFDKIKPIPLTEDWLIKFGFELKQRDKYFKGKLVVIKEEFAYKIGIKDESNVLYHITLRLKYVHQLQNLYFALTGKELFELFLKEKEDEK